MKESCKKRVYLDLDQVRNPGLADAVLEDAKKAVMMEVLQKVWEDRGENIVSFCEETCEDPALQARGMFAVTMYGIWEPIIRCRNCKYRRMQEWNDAFFAEYFELKNAIPELVNGFLPDSICPFRGDWKNYDPNGHCHLAQADFKAGDMAFDEFLKAWGVKR